MSESIEKLTVHFLELLKKRGLEGRTFTELATEFASAAPQILESDLIRRLHEVECHPDYEYTSVEHQRKSCVENPPEGHGWEVNKDLDDGVTRDDFTEDHHYRRLKSDARKDTVRYYQLPKLVLEKVTLATVLEHLRGIWNGHRIAGGQASEHEFYSKPDYTDRPEDVFNAIESALASMTSILESAESGRQNARRASARFVVLVRLRIFW